VAILTLISYVVEVGGKRARSKSFADYDLRSAKRPLCQVRFIRSVQQLHQDLPLELKTKRNEMSKLNEQVADLIPILLQFYLDQENHLALH
jgi:hypothetical protein